jgi:glucose/arabinose dehydrogenase
MTRLFVCLFVATLLVVNDAQTQAVQLVNAFPNLTFNRPIHITHADDGTNRLFAIQQNGHVIVFANDSATSISTTFLDIEEKISSVGDEEGLLGLAFHPNYTTNGYFYVNYTAPSPLRTVIARYSVSPTDPDKADSLSEYKILEILQPEVNHNGGTVAFGPDSFLYIGMGDGGPGLDPENRAQDRTQLLGKFLRINVNDTTATTRYTIPPDNPFVGNPNGYKEEIWAWGFRNPWKFSFDHITGQLWTGDVGQSDREEVDLVERGGNYGWVLMEGSICNPWFSTCDTAGLMLILPVKDYGRSLGTTVIGGHVYRGYRRPELNGAYMYGDFSSGRIWMLRYENGQLTADSLLIQTPYLICSFGVDQDKELYVGTYSHTSGIYRFAGPPRTTEVSTNNNLPLVSRLEQNYPNPFNPSTTIRYQLPVASHVSLKVFDVLGREVVTLVKGPQTAGVKNVMFDGSNRASGVYVYRLTVGSFVETRRMLLLK